MHAKSGLRVVLEWKIYRPDSVIAAVIPLMFRLYNIFPFETPNIARTSIVVFLIGICSLEYLHRFTPETAETAISSQLENQNPIAWLFFVSLLVLVGLSLYVQWNVGNWFHALLLAVSLSALIVVGTTSESFWSHQLGLSTAIACLGCSTLIIASHFRILGFVTVCATVFSSVFCALLLFGGYKPGIAERLLYLVYGGITTYALCKLLTQSPAG